MEKFLQLKINFGIDGLETSFTHLQARLKWHQPSPSFECPGDLVLIQIDKNATIILATSAYPENQTPEQNIPQIALPFCTPSGPAKRAINRLIALPVPTWPLPGGWNSSERQDGAMKSVLFNSFFMFQGLGILRGCLGETDAK
ncbi:hypothetical protein HNY73_013049 [Argiope bruennichi]|uniref:Uncharacterized protein n=1 Tax=Argiope bruennichi TaxID=94029 RepID=A0A8T0EYH5_ARGBR|nr:hypothetical protein HNY73_013049 [Argiope bruennichi]